MPDTASGRRIVVACDSFKGSLTAAEASAAVVAGVRDAWPGARCVIVPVADGGEGTVAAALAAGFAWVPAAASGPLGDPLTSGYAVRSGLAAVELAEVCGLLRLPGGGLAPLAASSRGCGEVLAAALANPAVNRVVLAVGGSASTDGGAGLLRALGVRFLDASGEEVGEGGGRLCEVERLDWTGFERWSGRLSEVEITLASDVTHPLTGPHGAAAVFGPQKGAGPADVVRLEEGLGRLADFVAARVGRDDRHREGAGAAGGVGFAALAVLGARQRPGIDVVLEWSDFHRQLAAADLVITGEGSLDRQSLSGKAPVGIARKASARGIPVVALCGRSCLTHAEATAAGFAGVFSLAELEPDPRECQVHAAPLLREVAASVCRARDTMPT